MDRDSKWLGYPNDYIADAKKTRKGVIIWGVLLGVPTVVFSLGFIFDWSRGLFCYAPMFAVLYSFFLFIAWLQITGLRQPKILPYFKKGKGTPEGSTLASGKALARNCRYLDEIATEHRYEPLSTFGFADDDFEPHPIEWFNSERGLKTVSFLIAYLQDNPEAVPEADSVISDLSKIEFRLKDASNYDIDFRFILSYGGGTSERVEAMRRGTYF